MLFRVPAVDPERFIMFTFLDAWTNAFESPGTCRDQRDNNVINGDKQWLIAGPSYEGAIPEGYSLIRAPTNRVWMLGRIELLSPDDFDGVAAVQEQLDLRPLSALDDPNWAPTSSPLTPAQAAFVSAYPERGASPDPQQIIRDMDAQEFFDILSRLLATQPPAADEKKRADLAKIGLTPGGFDYDALPLYIRRGLEEGIVIGQGLIDAGKTLTSSGPEPWGPSADVPLGGVRSQPSRRCCVLEHRPRCLRG